MNQPDPREVTILLGQVQAGKPEAVKELFTLVYDELRTIAASHFRHQAAHHTLQPTALIHEAYLRMTNADSMKTHDRSHFFALASRVMRQLLVDHHRGKSAAKRGGGRERVSLETASDGAPSGEVDLIDLDTALERLAAFDERKSRVVELRFFGGLTVPEVASVLDVSVSTVESDWAMARAWLERELDSGEAL